MRKRIVLGAGQCGMKLAHNYYHEFKNADYELLALSTSTEDSVGIPKTSLIQVATEGSGKRFSSGSSIWDRNKEKLDRLFEGVIDTDIIYFTSAGGGSGSSSIPYVAEQTLRLGQNNRIFLVLVLPFGYEALPFKPNALRSLSSLQAEGLLDKMSILLFDNDKLSKQYFDIERSNPDKPVNLTNLEKINQHIISSTSMVLDLIRVYHDPNKFSPFTIDEIEHDSVIFSNGFIGVDSRKFDGAVTVKFDYGKLTDAKNVIIAKAVGLGESQYTMDQTTGIFLENVRKISRRAKNARIMYGMIRTDKIDSGTYIIIGNNLDVVKYVSKIKSKIELNVQEYLRHESREKLLTRSESRFLDI